MSSGCDEDGQVGYENGTDEVTGGPSTDTVFRVLGHRYRRYVLDCLREHRTLSLEAVADEVAVREFGRPIDEISAESVKQIHLRLHHTDIPKLEAASMVSYDQAEESVAAGDAIERAVPFLALIDDEAIEAV